MIKGIKRFLGFWTALGGVLLIVWWFVSSFMAEEVNLLMGVASTIIGLPMAVFGWHIWKSNIEAKKKDEEWACEECGNKIHKNDKFCSKCGTEFE
jgi:cadmium resistance protein CadD (predicted permease)